MRPSVSWAIDSEPIRARGIIVDYIARCAHAFSELAIELLPSLPKGDRWFKIVFLIKAAY